MQSFRTELENPIVEKDIIDLEKKIRAFREGKIHDEKFRSLRLARGIYGQRQPGVQMIRIKLPFGKVTFKQILRIADISDEYASSNLHLTTRQDIQIHYVSLDRTPQLWAELEKDDITLREACGNTVRNVTASPAAGIDPNEPFDVSPYAYGTFDYLLRNPVNQDMPRKFKISFSSSDEDTAYSFIHDIGLIPKLKENGERGFKVMLGGGLGAQPILANIVEEFLPEDQLIPYIESIIRVFDRYGERNNRNKARLKYLIQKIGLEEVLRLAAIERTAGKVKSYKIDRDTVPQPNLPQQTEFADVEISNPLRYEQWLATNVFEQKQKGFYGVYIKVETGDIPSDKARKLVAVLTPLTADEIRITQNQGLLLKYVRKEALPALYNGLNELDMAAPGFDSVADVTTCPGTDTCNLGISNSMTFARVLEDLIYNEYEDLIYNRDIKIKISGCMNSCGQHSMAHIGFHGSSLKAGAKVLPSMQVMLGGGTVGDGIGRAGDRVIKVPAKRATDVLRMVLNDYKTNSIEDEVFHNYYDRQGKDYFYQMLKPLADLTTLTDEDFVDWGHQETYVSAIGVGECAGVVIDLVATLLYESDEKMGWANESFVNGAWSDAIYHSYNVLIGSAKALLLDKGINSSTQAGIIREFDTQYVSTGEIELDGTFNDLVLQINQNEPSESFATAYKAAATEFLETVKAKEKRYYNHEYKRGYFNLSNIFMTLLPENNGLTTVQDEKTKGNQLFPVFLKLNELHTVLIGAGNVGLEKLTAILQNSPDASVTVIAESFISEIDSLTLKFPGIKTIQKSFSDDDLDKADIVIAATNDPKLNNYIRDAAHQRKLLINVADKPELCDFYLGSIVQKGDLKIGISTNGKSPTIAKRLREVLNESLPAELDISLQQMSHLRNSLAGDFTEKVKKLNEVTSVLVEPKLEQRKNFQWLIWLSIIFSLAVAVSALWFNEPGFRKYAQEINPIFYYFLGAGFVFALIDGAIGMSYGVTSTTFSLSMGIPPASASMGVHLSEILSNGIAGWMHYRMGNINWRMFKMLLIPGIVGAVLGAYILSSLEHYSQYSKPFVSLYTLILGVVIFTKALNLKRKRTGGKIKRIPLLGFGGGFIDAVGGGGWGSIVLSTLIAGGRNARFSLGTVKLSRFFIALMSSLTFITMINGKHWEAVAGLVLGSALASPIAAKISNKISTRAIMLSVAVIVILISLKSIVAFITKVL